MHLLLIIGIAIAIGSVMFALQNNIPVTVTFAIWRFDSSLAMVLLLALGLGVLVAALLSSTTMIKNQWNSSRLRRQLAQLEKEKTVLERKIHSLESAPPRINPPIRAESEEVKPYVGLKTLLSGQADSKTD